MRRERKNKINMIEWNENLSVGCYAIDEQHKELIKLINDVQKIIRNKEYTFSNLMNVVYKLDNYVEQHFTYEEMLMNKSLFPEKENHIKEHELARKKMDELNVIEEERYQEKFFCDTFNWWVRWLINHIMNTDKKLEPYL